MEVLVKEILLAEGSNNVVYGGKYINKKLHQYQDFGGQHSEVETQTWKSKVNGSDDP